MHVFDIHWAGFLVYDQNQCFGLGHNLVSMFFYKCDNGLGRYWLSRDFGRQPVPAVPGQSRVATRITLCPLQANVKDNDEQLKARGAGKKAA